MIFPLRQTALCSMLLFVLAGCGEPVISRVDEPSPSRFEAYYSGMAADKDLFVAVRGTPFGGTEKNFAPRVAASVQPPAWLPRPAQIVPLTTTSRVEPPFRVVLLFGAPGNVGGAEACKHGNTVPVVNGPLPRGSVVTVQGAVCYNDEYVTEAVGEVTNVSGPDDPRFKEMIHELSASLMPPASDNTSRGGSRSGR